MTTPKVLDTFALDKGWSDQRLSDAIYDATGIRISYRSLARYRRRIGRPTKVTRHAIEKFMAAQRHEASR